VTRKVFYSFRYDVDHWRVQQVMNMDRLEGQPLLSSQKWEDVARGGDPAIKKWINEQMADRSCDVVLIGSGTANRNWVNYEIEKAWRDGKGVVGVYVHRLEDSTGRQDSKGANPFGYVSISSGWSRVRLSSIVKAYDPPYLSSTAVYSHIKDNLQQWVEEAIRIRKAR
jgi:hypothetical protein